MTRNRIIGVFLAALLAIAGCGRTKTPSDGGGIIARINGYEMTAEDFRQGARLGVSRKELTENPDRAKELALEELITRNILIQEAQRQNFDKDRAFMDEIESYWEQALLKLLLKKKMSEFAQKFSGENEDVRNQSVGEALDKWIVDLRNKASVKIYKENLKDLKLGRKGGA